jgi:hypothetical protein
MNSRQAAEIALGVAGIWLIVSRIPDFGTSLALWPFGPDGALHWVGVIHFALVAGSGFGLLLCRRRLAAWLVSPEVSNLDAPVAGLQAAAFSVVGVILLAEGLANLLGRLVMALPSWAGVSFTWLAVALAQVVVGLALFLGAGRLARIGQRSRLPS